MARTLRIETAASPSLLLQRARRAAKANGVLLLGDENSGRFSHGMLEGNYRRQGPTVIVTVIHKHRLVPWSVLEDRLKGLFAGGPSRTGRASEKSPKGRRRVAAGDVERLVAGPHTITGIRTVAGIRPAGKIPLTLARTKEVKICERSPCALASILLQGRLPEHRECTPSTTASSLIQPTS